MNTGMLIHNRVRGFTLIEVLIALVVFSTGLLALAALQASLVRSSADSKQRSQIASYVDSLFESAHANYGGVENVLNLNAAQLAQVAADAGVSGLQLATNASSVVEYGYCATQEKFVVRTPWPAGCGTFSSGTPKYKQLTLTLEWTDSVGAPRQMQFKSAVSQIAMSSGQTLTNRPVAGGTDVRPIVRRATPDGEGIIPIAMGDGRETAATNPRPELAGRRNDTLVADTRFEIITFRPAGTAAEVQSRVETAVVGCSCETGNNFASGGFSGLQADRSFRPTYWDGVRYVEPAISTYGVLGSPQNATQSDLCDTCCRDHHDPSGTAGPKVSPFRSSHSHHAVADGPAVAGGGATKPYLEACRLIRVNGMFRVASDLKQESVALVPTNALGTSPSILDARERYEDFAISYINARFVAGQTPDEKALAASAGLDEPSQLVLAPINDSRWLHARGLALDYLEPAAVEKIEDALTPENCTQTNKALCVLPFIPLTTVNVTELAAWTAAAGQAQPGTRWLRVDSPSDVLFGDPINPKRGASRVDSSVNLGTITVVPNFSTANLGWSNSGLALFTPINPDDLAEVLRDEQQFLTAGTGASGLAFAVTLNGLPATSDNTASNDPSVELPSVTAGFPNPCNANTARRQANPYACDWQSTTSPTATTVSVGKYNFRQATNTNVSNTCPGGTGTSKKNECVYYPVSSVTGTGMTIIGYALDPTTNSVAQRVNVQVGSLTSGSSMTVTFGTPTVTDATSSCLGSQVVWTCP